MMREKTCFQLPGNGFVYIPDRRVLCLFFLVSRSRRANFFCLGLWVGKLGLFGFLWAVCALRFGVKCNPRLVGTEQHVNSKRGL
jgi:hypothetical protein